MCFVRISEQRATFALCNINRLVFITEVESVYSAVRTDFLYKIRHFSSLKGSFRFVRLDGMLLEAQIYYSWKKQFVVTHRYTVLQERKNKTWQILNRPTAKHVMFYENTYKG
jgi:hypothetical protein